MSLRLKDSSVVLLRRGLLLYAHEKELFWLPVCGYFVSWLCEAEQEQLKAMLACKL